MPKRITDAEDVKAIREHFAKQGYTNMRCAVVSGGIHDPRKSGVVGVTSHRGLVRSRTLSPCPDLPVCRRPAPEGQRAGDGGSSPASRVTVPVIFLARLLPCLHSRA